MKHFLPFAAILMSLTSCGSNYKNLDIAEFEKTIADGAVAVVDVRTQDEYAAGHLQSAANCDWYANDFIAQIQSTYPKGTPLAIYCRSGKRSAAAAKKLARAGYEVFNMTGGYLAWTDAGKPTTTYEVETFFTDSGIPVTITLIKHGTLAISYKGRSIQIDPVCGLGKPTDYAAEFPKADAIIITHEHGDHLDKAAIEALYEEGKTTVITNSNCAEMLGLGNAMANGDSNELFDGINMEAVPAYNYSEGHTMFHPKGRDNGFVLTMDGLRIYIAGDTEDIPELADLTDIDIAFLPVNQPYTMTIDQCIKAAKTISPSVLIPYHFSDTDLSDLPNQLPGIRVLLRQMQ